MSSERLKQAATGQRALTPVQQFSGFLDRLKPQMAVALPKHMNADRMARLALTAFSSNEELQKCSAGSIAASIMTAAQLGLEPGINGQGYLIPYKGTCTFVPGWKGLVDLVARAGRATVWTGVVHEGDSFEYQLGDAPFCRHIPGDGEEGDTFTHVYAIGRVRDAQMPVIEVWTRAKVKKHLNQYNKVGGRHYAMQNENNLQMYARKVALLQVLKYMPSSIELANAIEVSHAGEAGQAVTLEGDFVTVHAPEDDRPETPAQERAETPQPEANKPKPDSKQAKPPAFDEKAYADKLRSCTDPDTLSLMADELRDITDEAVRTRLQDVYRARLAELEGS